MEKDRTLYWYWWFQTCALDTTIVTITCLNGATIKGVISSVEPAWVVLDGEQAVLYANVASSSAATTRDVDSRPEDMVKQLKNWLEYMAIVRAANTESPIMEDDNSNIHALRYDGRIWQKLADRFMTKPEYTEVWNKGHDAYTTYSGNHPTIHCNRFPDWSELSPIEKRKWILPFAAKVGVGRDPG